MKPAADGALALALRRACGQQKIMQRGRPVRVGRPSLPQVLQLLALKWKGHQHSAGLALARRMGPHATGVFAPQPLILPFECGLVCRAPRARRSFLASQACSELSPFSGSWARSEAACNRTCAKKEPERAPPPQWQLQPDTRFRHAQRCKPSRTEPRQAAARERRRESRNSSGHQIPQPFRDTGTRQTARVQ